MAVVAQGLGYVVLLISLEAAIGREDLAPRGLDSPWLCQCWNQEPGASKDGIADLHSIDSSLFAKPEAYPSGQRPRTCK